MAPPRLSKRIQNRHILREITGVAGDEIETMSEGGRGGETVHEGKFASSELVFCLEPSPSGQGCPIYGDQSLGCPVVDAMIPLLDFVPSVSPFHQVNAFKHFAQRQDTGMTFQIATTEPLKD